MRSTPPARSLPSSVMGEPRRAGEDRRRPDGGVTRVAWSAELFAAYEWVGDRMRELGLESRSTRPAT